MAARHMKSAAIAGLLSLAASFASAAGENGADPKVEELLKRWQERAVTASGSKLQRVSPDMAWMGSLSDPIPFGEYLPTQGGLRLVTSLPSVGTPDRPLPDMRELMADFLDACKEVDGRIEMVPSKFAYRPEFPVIDRALKQLGQSRLMGDFYCKSQGQNVLWLQVFPSPSVKMGLIPFSGYDWIIMLQLMGRDQLGAQGARYKAYVEAVEELRAQVSAGSQVQVRTTGLPSSINRNWIKAFGDRPGSMCALVLDVKPPLAQVQIGTTSLSVPIVELFPAGKAKASSAVGSADLNVPQDWCMKE